MGCFKPRHDRRGKQAAVGHPLRHYFAGRTAMSRPLGKEQSNGLGQPLRGASGDSGQLPGTSGDAPGGNAGGFALLEICPTFFLFDWRRKEKRRCCCWWS